MSEAAVVSAAAVTYKAGDKVVVEKSGGVIRVWTFDSSECGPEALVSEDDNRAVWHQDGRPSTHPLSDTNHKYGRILRHATTAEIDCGRKLPDPYILPKSVRMREGDVLIVPPEDRLPESTIRAYEEWGAKLKNPNVISYNCVAENTAYANILAEFTANPTKHKRRWASSVRIKLGKAYRHLSQIPRMQLVGLHARALEVQDALVDRIVTLQYAETHRKELSAKVASLSASEVSLRTRLDETRNNMHKYLKCIEHVAAGTELPDGLEKWLNQDHRGPTIEIVEKLVEARDGLRESVHTLKGVVVLLGIGFLAVVAMLVFGVS